MVGNDRLNAPLSAQEFLELVVESGLLTPTTLETFSASLTRSPNQVSGEDAARRLVEERLLTPFQSRQLKRRRFRGFFVSDKYKILDFLGEGGMGRVVLCEHMMLQRLVAVKLLNLTATQMPGVVERFLREARASAALDHPNVGRVYDVDRSDRGPYMVMEYIDGTNLHRLIRDHGPLSIDRTVNYLTQAAAGLQQAHKAGLVHRDIKPSNLMLDRGGTIKLLDMGLARFFDAGKNDNLTQAFDAKAILGTADFVAPEQALDSAKVDIRGDIYSLGLSMYFLLTGKLPLPDGSAIQKLLWHQVREPEPIENLRPEVPAELVAIFTRMTKKNPADRFQTPAELIAALKPLHPGVVDPPPDAEMPANMVAAYRLGLASSPRGGGPMDDTAQPKSGSSPGGPPSQLPSARSSSGMSLGGSGFDGSGGIAVQSAGAKTASLLDEELPEMSPLGQVHLSGPSMLLRPAATATAKKHEVPWVPIIAGSLGGIAVLAMIVGMLFVRAQYAEKPSVAGNITTPPPVVATPPVIKPPAPPVTPPKEVTPPPVAVVGAPKTGITLRGGGSTFVKPIMEHWAKIYEAETGTRIEYSAEGSSKGVQGMMDKFLDFGCTDAFISDAKLADAGNGVIHIPLVMGAVVPTYNVLDKNGVPLELRFTGPLLANIYLGKVKKWNDGAIAVNNPGKDLPDTEIVPVYRSDGSGTTAIFTDYMSKTSAAWKAAVGSANEVKWPVGVGAKKNDGVATAVSATNGAIGYVELSFALANSLSIGDVKNKSGAFITPSIEGVVTAAAAQLPEIPEDFRYSLTDAGGQASYPIVGTCWAVVFVDQPAGKGGELVKFLRWATTDGQKYAADLRYGRLPEALSERVHKKIGEIRRAE